MLGELEGELLRSPGVVRDAVAPTRRKHKGAGVVSAVALYYQLVGMSIVVDKAAKQPPGRKRRKLNHVAYAEHLGNVTFSSMPSLEFPHFEDRRSLDDLLWGESHTRAKRRRGLSAPCVGHIRRVVLPEGRVEA